MPSVRAARWSRFSGKWRWKICCSGVTRITYAAIYIALALPSNHSGARFLLTAFPAAIIQFLLIDITRNGFKVNRNK